MTILAIDSSSISGCCGVMRDGKLLATGFVNSGLTHSQTLLPLITDTCEQAGIHPSGLDLIGITVGPGSFTGVRIGLATAKGIAAPFDTKCVGISTLEAIAETAKPCADGGILCPVMDARCSQVYNALFKVRDDKLVRFCEDRALSIEELHKELLKSGKKIIFCGDGAEKCAKEYCGKSQIATDDCVLPRGGALCALAEKYKDKAVSSKVLNPFYLRLPRAERELKSKKVEEQ